MHPIMKKLLFAFFLFSFCLYLGEQYFKKKFKPGFQTHYSGFEIVDSLVLFEDYYTDTFGNYVLSPLVSDSLKKDYNQQNCDFDNLARKNRIASVDGITHILKDFCMLKQKNDMQYPFEKYIGELHKLKNWSKSDSAIMKYASYPFNSQGFRSIEIENYKSEKIKVMIVGDSFVWGMSANPYYNSFADVLLSRDYQVFNLGIPSVDPIQYYSICKNYVDSIQPDFVIINFFEGNDFMNHKRVHAQGIPSEYISNAGFFESTPQGKFLSAKDAYNFYADQLRIPSNSALNKLLSKTAIGSIIWTQTHPKTRYQYTASLTEEESIAYTTLYLDSIVSFLEGKNLNYFFTITPDESAQYNEKQTRISYNKEKIDLVFADLPHYIPSNLKHEDYNQPKDFHFNNSGSLKYANFIDSLIQEKLRLD